MRVWWVIWLAVAAALWAGDGDRGSMAISFDASGERLERTTALPALDGTNDFTVMFWYRPVATTPTGGAYRTVWGMTPDNWTSGIVLRSSADTTDLYPRVWSSSGSWEPPTYKAILAPDRWFHICLIKENNNWFFFVDGLRTTDGSFALGSQWATPNLEQLGGDGWSSLEITDYRAWSVALGETALNLERASAVPVRTANLVQASTLDGASDLDDDSGNGSDWTAAGGTLGTSATDPTYPTWSISSTPGTPGEVRWSVNFSEGSQLYDQGTPPGSGADHRRRWIEPTRFNEDFPDLTMAENVTIDATGGPDGSPCLTDYDPDRDIGVGLAIWDLRRSGRTLYVPPGGKLYFKWNQYFDSEWVAQEIYAPMELGDVAYSGIGFVLDYYNDVGSLELEWEGWSVSDGSELVTLPVESLVGGWHTMKIEVQLATWSGTVGDSDLNADGWERFYIDGELVAEVTDIRNTVYSWTYEMGDGGVTYRQGLISMVQIGYGIAGKIDNLELGVPYDIDYLYDDGPATVGENPCGKTRFHVWTQWATES